MPHPVQRGQLPISLFTSKLGTSSKRGSKTTSAKVSSTRRGSPGRDQDAEPPKKKRKQRENLTPLFPSNDVDSEVDEPANNSRPRPGPRQRRTSDSKAGTEDSEGHEGEHPGAVLDESVLPTLTQMAFIDLTTSELEEGPRLEATETHRLGTPPITERHRGTLAAKSFPSPPLTAPDARRQNMLRRDEERHVEEMLEGYDDVQNEGIDGPAPSKADVEKDACEPIRRNRDNADGMSTLASCPRQSSLVLMPPPKLPAKAASASTSHQPIPVPVQKPSSVSSDRWVPSSQTQELSIPAHYVSHHDHPCNAKLRPPSVGETQSVPSSQMDEIELQMPSTSACGSGTSQVHPPRPQVYIPSSTRNDVSRSTPSPEFVESSQELELELDAAWAETVAARHAAIKWSKDVNAESEHRTPSPSSRESLSQGYEAQDEFSSQEGNSQPSSFDIIPTPLHVSSQMTESSASYDSQSTLNTPPQLRRFRSMFVGRDERGNELPSTRRSPSPGSYDEDEDDGDQRSIPEQHSSDDSYSYGSSLSETQPTPVRNFMAMFERRDVEPSQGADDW